MIIETNIPYREASGYDPALNTLDIYCDPLWKKGPPRRVVVFIHGGNWSGGDKSYVTVAERQRVPAWFVERGCVFVAINFRLPGSPGSPDARIADMADDIAKALKWLTVNGRRYGGAPSGFVLLGFSSGAHLAALVAADERYLRRYRLASSVLRAVIAVDVPHFDLPHALDLLRTELLGLSEQAQRLRVLYRLMGRTAVEQQEVSPAAYVGPALRSTAFLLLSAGMNQGQAQSFSCRMSERFLGQLQTNGVVAEHRHFADSEHAALLSGFPGEVSECVQSFLDAVAAASSDSSASESGLVTEPVDASTAAPKKMVARRRVRRPDPLAATRSRITRI